VAAVRLGDAERYRELVERHERRVFAVAWSRLGDATLAEEAAQEAFIRGYRRLWLLGDGAKFATWITTIARHAAINLGLRHRRELNRRQRWALENFSETAPENSSTENEPLPSPEMLRQTLAELPDSHRECLVLFYLEGKSGAEAAAALGISEPALRVRLHRARAALRERLEEKLEGSLANLRPTKTFVSAIMAGVLASSSAKAATAGGIGATILGTLAKFTPLKWLFMFAPMIMPAIILLPGFFMQRWRLREELKNYRDPDGFRAKLHQQFGRKLFGAFALMIVVGLAAGYLSGHSRVHLDSKFVFFLIGCFGLRGVFVSGRLLEINRSRFQVGALISGLTITGACFAVVFGLMSAGAIVPFCLLSVLVGVFSYNHKPLRMDHNLFLRAAQGMFPNQLRARSAHSQTRETIRRFARFLSEHHFVAGFRWLDDGLMLSLPRVGTQAFQSWSGYASAKKSIIVLHSDGGVSAHCGEKDAAALLALADSRRLDLSEAESRVASALAQAWQYFEADENSRAEFALGQVPDEEIFVKPAAKMLSRRWTLFIFGVFGGLALALTAAVKFYPAQFARLDGLKPVNLTQTQVHEFMSLVSTNPNPLIKTGEGSYMQNGFARDPRNALFGCLVLPETNLFTSSGLDAIHSTILGASDLDAWRQNPKRLQLFMNSQFHRAIDEGWLSWQELNLQPADCKAFLHTNRSLIYAGALLGLGANWNLFLSRCDAWSWVQSQHYDVMRIQNWGVWDLRFLGEVNSLDLVDREKLIQQIAAVQTLSAHPPGNPPIHDWQDVRGLFFTPCFPALQDTYRSLAALEILGGLDRIDREQCIRGILRAHRGRGFFTSPNSGGYNEYHIDGSAEDTIAAYESLRILGALDRVKDLSQWQFRVNRRHLARDEVTWQDIEAWVCQQRLEKIQREHKANPSAPYRSLLEP